MHFELFKKKINEINEFITFLQKTFVYLLNRQHVTLSLGA